MTDKENEWLDAMLKEDNAYIADNGFTGSVLSALPARRKKTRRTPIILGSAAVAFIVCFLVFPGAEYLMGAVSNVLAFGLAPSSVALPITSLVVLAFAVLGGVAVATNEA